jgi:hypothetical protein
VQVILWEAALAAKNSTLISNWAIIFERVNFKMPKEIFKKTLLLILVQAGFLQPLFAAELDTEFDTEYAKGDVVSADIFVADKDGSQVHLSSLLGESESGINVLFIFGGGDLGAGLPGHLWCPDSFEDTHILRTLYGKYAGKGVNFIAVGVAPVYHSQILGQKAGVFLTDAESSADFQQASKAFVASTFAAHNSGILPVEPYLDTRFRLMFNRSPDLVPQADYGEVFSWQGVFRNPQESQFYGVPGFWILDNKGKVLTVPFRGNIYHPHGADVTINYTFRDIDGALADLL